MNRFWTAIATGFLLFSVFVGDAYADKVLFISPTRVELSDKDRVETINVTNLSDIARSYSISIQNLVMTPEGITQQVDNFDYSARRMLRFVPRQFVLQPDERQTVRIMARPRPDTSDGQYHSHLRFLENVSRREEINQDRNNTTGASMQAPLSYAAAIPVTVTLGQVNTALGMKDVSVRRNPESGRYEVSMILTREGNGQGTALIDTEYLPPGGEPVKATVRRTVQIYREINERKKDYKLSLPEGRSFEKGGKIKITLYNKNSSENADPADQVILDVPL